MMNSFLRNSVLVALLSSTPALAQDIGTPEGNGAVPGSAIPWYLEFSTSPDKEGGFGVPFCGAHISGSDAEQTLKARPKDSNCGLYPQDAVDYGLNGEVDALATSQDFLFDDLWNGTGIMIYSVNTDPGNGPPDLGVLAENPNGTCSDLLEHRDLFRKVLVGEPQVGEVDALNGYGPPTWSNSMHFSLNGDPTRSGLIVDVITRTSVFHSTYCGISECLPGLVGQPAQKAYITQNQIYNALLSLNPSYTGPEADVDVDALMVSDANVISVWDAGDRIIFSIRPAGNFDGGEIIKLPNSGAASYLVHGGHTWDTSYDVPSGCGGNPDRQDVDALEMIRSEERGALVATIPALSEWGLVVLTLLLAVTATVVIRTRVLGTTL